MNALQASLPLAVLSGNRAESEVAALRREVAQLRAERARLFQSERNQRIALEAVRTEQERARELAEMGIMAERAARAEAEDARRRMAAVLLVSDAALTHLQLDALLEVLLARVRHVFDSDIATLLLLSADGQRLAVR